MQKIEAWVGADYEQAGRIVILGESNWGVGDMTDAEYVRHWLEHPNFLKNPDCPTCVRCGKARHPGENDYPRDRLNDALTTMMIAWKKVTGERRSAACARIAFTNFILRPPHSRDSVDRPIAEDWTQATREFPARLCALRPRVCLVLDNPSGILMSSVRPTLEQWNVSVVRLSHPTMRPAPRREQRAEAWRTVLDATRCSRP